MNQNAAASCLTTLVGGRQPLLSTASGLPSSSSSWNRGAHSGAGNHSTVAPSGQNSSGGGNSISLPFCDAKHSNQSSSRSSTTLQEHDLLGLSDVSSSSRVEESIQSGYHGEGSEELTELRLGPSETPAGRKEDSYFKVASSEQVGSSPGSGSFLVVLNQEQVSTEKPTQILDSMMAEIRPDGQSVNMQHISDARYAQVDRSPMLLDFAAIQKLRKSNVMRAVDGSRATSDFQSTHPTQDMESNRGNGYSGCGSYSGARALFPKCGVSGEKRGFSEALGSGSDLPNGFQESRGVVSEGRPGVPPNASTGGNAVSSVNGGSSPTESEQKGGCTQQQKLQSPSPMYAWTPKPMPSSWQMGGLEQSGSFGPFPSQRPVSRPSVLNKQGGETPPTTDQNQKSWESHTKNLQDGFSKADPKHVAAETRPEPATASPASDNGASTTSRAGPQTQAVGWPPLRSFRKNTLSVQPAVQPRPSETPIQPRTSVQATGSRSVQSNVLLVKVYMDGVPFGRKVDLKSNSSYEKLSSALEEMFCGFANNALSSDSKRSSWLHGSDYVLTYEDQDGDLMLVGDVPWTMFLDTVKRLRIMKGSEAIGLGSRAAEKVKSQNNV